MDLRLELLATLGVVSDAGGVSRAAERLGVSQPTVTRQLQQLERISKVKVLERAGRGVQLTPVGQRLARLSRDIDALVVHAQQDLEDLQRLRTGSLHFGAGTTLAVHLLPAAIVRFSERFPDISVRAEAAASERLAELLRQNAVDFALSEAMLPAPEFDSVVCWLENLVAIVAPSHSLSGRKTVSIADLIGERLIVRQRDTSGDSLVERTFRQSRKKITPAMSFGSTEAVKYAVAAGLGVSIVPRMSAAMEVAAGSLVAIPLKGVDLRRPIYLSHLRGRTATKPEVAFLCILKHVIRGTLPKRAVART